MPRQFLVDRWSLESDGDVKYRRFEFDTEAEALYRLDTFADLPSSSRIVVRKRGSKPGISSVVKVWERQQ